MAHVRYIVTDVNDAVDFYVSNLGFQVKQQFGPAMAILMNGDLQLWLAGPKASASKPLPDGSVPCAGGWARFVLTVQNLDDLVERLKANGIAFKNDIVEGPGGRQALCLDPSGNIVELFEPVT